MRDRGRFQNFNFLAALHEKNTAIVIIKYTTAHVQSLSSFGANVVEIFEVVEDGWWSIYGSVLVTMELSLECK